MTSLTDLWGGEKASPTSIPTFKFPALNSPRNHEDNSYCCLCFSCGNQFLGPKRSVICKVCIDGKKPVDKQTDNT